MLKPDNSFFWVSSTSSEREAAVAILACFVDGYKVFAFSVIAFLGRSGCHMCKDPVSGTAVGLPFECEAVIMVGELPS